MNKSLVLCLLCTVTSLSPTKHIGFVVSYLEILKQANRFNVRRAQECFKLNECKEVRKDWSKNKDKVTVEHWDTLKEREALIYGDKLIAELNRLRKVKTSRMNPFEKKSHDKRIITAEYKIKLFLQTSLREIISKRLDSDLSEMKKKMKKLNMSIPKKLY